MNVRRLKAIVVKEFIQIFRDYRSLWMAVAIPVLLLTLFGYALTLDVDNVPFMIWDQSHTSSSRMYTLNFRNSRYFKLIGYCQGYEQIDQAINSNRIVMALVIPRDFAKRSDGDKKRLVQIIVDGSDSNTALIAIGYAEAINSSYNKDIIIRAMDKKGNVYVEPFQLRQRVWFNETLKSKNFIVPGLIAVIMMVISALLTSLTVAREWERGTMEQLISTPIKPGELILGKFIPYFIIGMFDVLLAFLMGMFIFQVPFRGSIALLFILSGLFLSGVLSWGILVSVLAKGQFMAIQISFITTFLPAFLLSGFAFPIANMPDPVKLLTYIVPARYFVTILKSIYLKGAGLDILWTEILPLVFFSALMIRMASGKFKKVIS